MQEKKVKAILDIKPDEDVKEEKVIAESKKSKKKDMKELLDEQK